MRPLLVALLAGTVTLAQVCVAGSGDRTGSGMTESRHSASPGSVAADLFPASGLRSGGAIEPVSAPPALPATDWSRLDALAVGAIGGGPFPIAEGDLAALEVSARNTPRNRGSRSTAFDLQPVLRGAGAVPARDLRRVLTDASLTAPRLGAARADVAAADAAVREAWGAYTPRLEASLAYEAFGRERTGIDSPRELVGGVSLSFGLLDPARGWRLEAARHRHGAARWNASATRDQLFLDIMEAWIQTVSAHETERALAGTTKAMGRLRDAVLAREREGYASKADIARLDADIASLEQEVLQAQLEARTQAATLSSLIARPYTPTAYPDVDRFLARGQTWLSNHAQRRNPALNASVAEGEALVADAAAARNDLLPGVDLTGSYDHAIGGVHTHSPSSYTVGVRVSMPIFAVTQQARADRLGSQAQAARWRLADQRRQVALQIETLWAIHQSSVARVNLAAEAIALNRRVLTSLQAQYSEGLAGLSDVLERQRLLVDAEFSHRKAILERTSAAIRLISTAGLSDALLRIG